MQNIDSSSETPPWYIKGQDTQALFYYQCERQFIVAISGQEIYRPFSSKLQEVTQIKLEADLYFNFFDDSEVIIAIDDQIIYQKLFYNSQIELYSNLCLDPVGNHYFTTIEIIFDFQVKAQNTISIKFNSLNGFSYYGIRNINLYTDGIQMSCPSNTPIMGLQSICTKTCDSINEQLQSPLLTNCISNPSPSNALLRIFPEQSNLIKYQIADSVWVSEEFKQSSDEKMKQIIFSTFTYALQNSKIQLQGIIFLIGEWKEGSYVRLKLNSTKDTTTIKSVAFQQESIQYYTSFTSQFKYKYVNDNTTTVTCTTIDCQQTLFTRTDYQYELVTINKTNNKFVANPSNLFDVYQTKLILLNGTTIPVSKVILNTELNIPSDPQFLTFSIEQNVQGDNAMYAFQNNIYIYSAAKQDSGCVSYSLQACIKCKSTYYVHLGKCVAQCPIHSRVLESVRNCTDYMNIETLQYTPGISQNSSGVYLIQDFYTLDFDSITIQKTFNIQPKSDNSFTNLLYSNLLNNKIIGGYATWGYGSYEKQFFDLPYHYQIRIYCTLYFIDGWSIEDFFIIKIDETEYIYSINDLEQQQLTGKSDVDYTKSVFIRHEHYDEQLSIKFTCLSEYYNDSREKSCGMNQIFILYDRNVNYLCPKQNEFYQQTSQTCAICTTKGIGCIEYISQAFKKCDYRCFSCSLDLNYCLTCDPALRRVFNNNQCICIDGYYELDDVPQCKKCPFPCLNCDESQCLSCVDDRELELGKCNCRQGYQEINKQCVPICDSTCLTCDGVSKSDCLTCDSLINRQLFDKQCLCKNGYFEDEIQGCLKSCLSPEYCYACDELDQCIQCLPNQQRVLLNNQCDCQQDYQENPITKLCEMICHYSCLTCSQPQSSNSCTSCQSKDVSFRELGNQSNCACIDGYRDEGNLSCVKIPNCHYSCNLCYESNNQNLCIDCQSNRYMNENKQCICKLGLKEIDQVCVLDNVDNNQSSGNNNQTGGNDNQNSGSDNQNGGNDHQNSGNDNQNGGNDNQNSGNDNQNGGNDNQNTESNNENGGNDNQNSGNDNQNGGNDNQNSGSDNPNGGNDNQNGGNNNQNIIECDDGNDLPRDGCFNNYIEQYWYCTPKSQSQYSLCSRCHANCIYCSSNSICELCLDGYYINNGDCLQCQSQCKKCNKFSSFCLECSDKSQNPTNGICQKCQSGYYLIHDTCQSVCGDGIVVGDEECDDSNNNSLDGCNSLCKVESNYKCSDSSCIPLPEIKKEVSLQQNNQVIISLQNINSNCSLVSLWIEQISAENYKYNVSQVESTQDSGMKCSIDFLFQQDVKPFNLIHVLVKKKTRILSDSDLVELLVQPQKKGCKYCVLNVLRYIVFLFGNDSDINIIQPI
ncbi:unnamed protein product (macronuclear) [Paramecium tetraurelia]|uniref:EGF-like domain-containing protein n=1 Tax=Paramecium tetraurelia TaxID=5888 RepID=A0DUT3_PARTE|nr:uncharacterized protein GSPATT00020462001 [Paramecium tetraurelia]CAK86800.1 unnamed protein product [Paramecium tetraurelia]|eukprot:XP_001454197.1 hypothetical protein (macronuclear) [Paramecium tetraurelia strain d4-2]